MTKIWLVLKNEFISVVTRKSFFLTLILLPLTSFVILLVVTGLQKSTGSDTSNLIQNMFSPTFKQTTEAFVDLSGTMKNIPEGFSENIIAVNSEQEARQKLENGEISAYYIIPQDFLATGDILYIRPDFNPLGSMNQTASIEAVVAYNLTEGNLDLANRLQNPINVTQVDLSNTNQRDDDHWLSFFLPYVITFLFYIVILTSSSLLLSSITNEKQNRVMEIIMTSITPRQMLTGKIIALGLVGLLQTVVWLGAGLLMLRYSSTALALSSAFQLPVSILIWGIFFFIFGYAVYASLMAGVGALVPNLKEASQLTTVVILPMIVPLMFISALIRTPDSPLSIVLSLFPFTAPVSMMTRLSASQVPFWQTGLAIVLLALTAVILVRASARLFQAKNLLSGQSLSARNFIRAMMGK